MTSHPQPPHRPRHAHGERVVAALRTVFGTRLRSVVAYGPHADDNRDGAFSCLALVTGVTIERADLRRACEAQIKSHLVHLREGFIEAGGTPRAIAELVTASAPAFGALLRNIARLNGSSASDRAAATRDGARAAQLTDGIVTDLLALERPSSVKATDAARLFPEYLAAVEQLARYVDAWNV